MKSKKFSTFTKVELEFMTIIWNHGAASTDDIQNALRETGRNLTDGGIRTILKVLMNKGFLSRKKRGRSFIYSAKIRKDEAERNMIHDLLDRAFSGSVPNMVSSLFNSSEISDDEIKAVKKIISEREKGK